MSRAAIISQGRVLHGLMLREIKSRFGKMKLGYLWAVLEPLLFIGFFAVLWSVARSVPAGLPLLPFLITSFGTYFFFRNLMSFTTMAVRINRALLTYPQVTPFGLVLARGLLELATISLVFAGLLFLAAALDHRVQVAEPLTLIVVLLLMAVTGLGMGFIVSTLVPIFPSAQPIVEVVIGRPAFFLSGLFYTAEMIPEDLRRVLLFNPLLHGTEIARGAYFIQYHNVHGDMRYLAAWAFGLLFVGLLTQRALRQKLYTR